MKNFIFKSSPDFHKMIFNKLVTIQNEQMHSRMDLGTILRLLKKLSADDNLQTQVDKYFDEDRDDNSSSGQE